LASQGKKKATIVAEGTEFAERVKLEYSIMPYQHYFLWQIILHTGKYHQIRAQLSNIGCSIIGDDMYGSTAHYFPNEIALHATYLSFKHPVTNLKMEFSVDPVFNL